MRAVVPDAADTTAAIAVSRFVPEKSAGLNQKTLANELALARSQLPPPVVPILARVASSPFGAALSRTITFADIVAQPIGRSSTTTASGSALPVARTSSVAALAPRPKVAVIESF